LIEKARPGGGLQVRRAGSRWRWPLLAALLIATGLAVWWLRAPETVAPPAPEPAAESVAEPTPLGAGEAARPAEPAAEVPEAAPEAPKTAEPLPKLADSDGFARELAGGVSKNGLFAALLAESGVIDRFVVITDRVADGQVPRRELVSLRPRGRFGVVGAEPKQRIDPASYRRYDALAEAIGALDARTAAAAYRRVAPLCEESYRALGYPEGGFEKRLRSALALLLSTPVLDADPAVVEETQRYEFAAPELESLSDAQKQLLRMGPANAKKVMAKLRELEAALGK